MATSSPLTMLPVIVINLILLVTSSWLPVISAGGSYSDLHPTSPERSAIVSLFEWRFDDIAEECEQFLGPKGFAAVQVSPVFEHAVIVNPWYEPAAVRPWYERYQPVSYKIATRSGDEVEFKSMVDRCNKAGVRVIVDVALNHMTGELDGVGTGGTPYKGAGTKEYPGVPYDPSHFNPRDKCPSHDGKVNNYDNPTEVRNCELFGLHDLNTETEYVRSKLREAVNSLIDAGVAGFRLDAAKHMWPADIASIFDGAHDLNVNYFPEKSRPLVIHEIMPGGAITKAEYTHLGRVLEFAYRSSMRDVFGNPTQKLKWLKNFGPDWNFVKSNDAIPLLDNHDLQRSEPMKGVNFRSPKHLQLASSFMLAWPYGLPNIMSSYHWPLNQDPRDAVDRNKYMGPPADDQQNIKRVVKKDDGSCEKPWVCEHRFNAIANMVGWRAEAEGEPVANWFDNGGNVIAFSRGSKAFIALSNEFNKTLTFTLQTGLPEGDYCDIINGNYIDYECKGTVITVDGSGTATIDLINGYTEAHPVPAVAIYTKSKITPKPEPVPEPQPEPEPEPEPECTGESKKTLDHCALCVQKLSMLKVEL